MLGFGNNEPIEGGNTTRIDSNAPKEINSDNLVALKTNFFLYSELGSEFDASYEFEIKNYENGKAQLDCTTGGKTINCEIDSSVLSDVNSIIKKYDLVKSNGIDKLTAGLPPEFDYSGFYAEYDSGETLSFSDNNNPRSEYNSELLKLFARAFADNGINDLLPPKETEEVVRFDFSMTDKDMCYIYGEILVPIDELNRDLEDIATNDIDEDNCITQIRKEPWDRSNKDGYEILYADPTPDYYEGLGELFKEIDWKPYTEQTYASSGFSYQTTPEYYEFYIEFAYGNKISGFSDDPETVEAFRPVAAKIMAYLDSFFK